MYFYKVPSEGGALEAESYLCLPSPEWDHIGSVVGNAFCVTHLPKEMPFPRIHKGQRGCVIASPCDWSYHLLRCHS